jgi:hypothetical protein
MEATYHQANGRFKFFEAIKTRNPEVLSTLHHEVLPSFKIAFAPTIFAKDPDARPSGFLEMKGSTYLEQLANMLVIIEQVIEFEATHGSESNNKNNSFMIACRISAELQEEIRRSSNEERWAFLEYWRHRFLPMRGATEMYIAVVEVEKAPIPINPYRWVKWSEIKSSPDPKLAKVRAAISDWAEHYNLIDPWILETVVQTLLLWMANLEYEEELRWAHAGYLCQIPQGARFQVELRPFESRKAFEHRAKDELKAFCSSNKYFLDVGHDHKYAFVWLAQFQTKLDSPRKIAIEFERETGERRTPSAIILAYQAAAEEIGLTLRQTLRGPKRQKAILTK